MDINKIANKIAKTFRLKSKIVDSLGEEYITYLVKKNGDFYLEVFDLHGNELLLPIDSNLDSATFRNKSKTDKIVISYDAAEKKDWFITGTKKALEEAIEKSKSKEFKIAHEKVSAQYIIAYTFHSGFRTQAEQTYKQMRLDGLNPKWGNTVGDMQILIPVSETKSLQNLQKFQPQRYGNLQEYKKTITASAEIKTANATSDYKMRLDLCRAYLRKIEKSLREDEIKQKQNPDDYGYAGSMGHVMDMLDNVVKFLRN